MVVDDGNSHRWILLFRRGKIVGVQQTVFGKATDRRLGMAYVAVKNFSRYAATSIIGGRSSS